MKFFSAPTIAICLVSAALLVNARPLPTSAQLARRAPAEPSEGAVYARLLAARDLEGAEFETRGLLSKVGSKLSGWKNKVFGPKKDIKATADVGNNRPETPVGQSRPLTAGRHDDYFGHWQTMVNGVDNPAAGKGKRDVLLSGALEDRDSLSKVEAKISGIKDKLTGPKKDTQTKYDVGENKPETPVGEFRPLTAGRHDDYFGNWQAMVDGVDNPATGRGGRRA
ncbi:hypothetical protein DXG01_014090 [Tephrocybe rancida]|nr:hypothetical protein DXG01_014090 [Tephrocybe rancida]